MYLAVALFFLLVNSVPGQQFSPSSEQDLIPLVQNSSGPTRPPMLVMHVAIATWIFVLGACFGSFLNVVIYRLPAGMSLGQPKSRCPRCETPLSARDNIPVLGWLMLRGRCRYCSLPVSPRYPIIEALCGGIFLTLLFVELLSGAANLPLRHPDHFHVHPGLWLVWFAKWDLTGIYLYHCLLLIVVLATVMIGYDGHVPQKKLTLFGLVVGLVAGMFWYELRPVPAYPWPDSMRQFAWGMEWTDPLLNPGHRYWTGISLVGLLDGVAGAAGGLTAGLIVRWQMRMSPFKGDRSHFQAVSQEGGSTDPSKRAGDLSFAATAAVSTSFLITGAFLGWQACGALLLFVLPAMAVAKTVSTQIQGERFFRLAALFFFAFLFTFVLCWRQLDDFRWLPGFDGWDALTFGWQIEWMITLAGTLVFASLARFMPDGLGNRDTAEKEQA